MYRIEQGEARKSLVRIQQPTLQQFQIAAGSLLVPLGEEDGFGTLGRAFNTLGATHPFDLDSLKDSVVATIANLLASCQANGIDATQALRDYLLKEAS